MRADIKARLIAALRSGTFMQIGHQLRGDSERDLCALGAIDELHYQAGLGPRHYGDALPQDVLDWADLTATAAVKLAALNNAGIPFSDIADLLERTDNDDDLPPPAVAALIPRLPPLPPLDAAAPRPREPAAV